MLVLSEIDKGCSIFFKIRYINFYENQNVWHTCFKKLTFFSKPYAFIIEGDVFLKIFFFLIQLISSGFLIWNLVTPCRMVGRTVSWTEEKMYEMVLQVDEKAYFSACARKYEQIIQKVLQCDQVIIFLLMIGLCDSWQMIHRD